jgi:hypothetical protein
LIHRGTPYFRNTTLVESLLGVGFLRFAPPVFESSDSNGLNGSGKRP